MIDIKLNGGIFKCSACGFEHLYGDCMLSNQNQHHKTGVLKITNVLGMISIDHPRLAYSYDQCKSGYMSGIQVDRGLDEDEFQKVCYLIATNYEWLTKKLNDTGEITTINGNMLPPTSVEEVEISQELGEVMQLFLKKHSDSYNDNEIMEMLSSPKTFLPYLKDFFSK